MTTTEQPQDWKTDSAVVSWSEGVTNIGHLTRHAYDLMLADGTKATGCAYCPRVFKSAAGVVSRHFPTTHREHSKAPDVPSRHEVREQVSTMSLDEVFDLAVTALQRKPRAENQEWKRRALKAEGELARLRKILSGP